VRGEGSTIIPACSPPKIYGDKLWRDSAVMKKRTFI
jgi:hypothetical protein